MTASHKTKSTLLLLATVAVGAAFWTPSAMAETSKNGYKYVSKCPSFDKDPFHECHNEEREKRKQSTFPPPAGAAPFDPFRTEGGDGGAGGNGRG